MVREDASAYPSGKCHLSDWSNDRCRAWRAMTAGKGAKQPTGRYHWAGQNVPGLWVRQTCSLPTILRPRTGKTYTEKPWLGCRADIIIHFAKVAVEFKMGMVVFQVKYLCRELCFKFLGKNHVSGPSHVWSGLSHLKERGPNNQNFYNTIYQSIYFQYWPSVSVMWSFLLFWKLLWSCIRKNIYIHLYM